MTLLQIHCETNGESFAIVPITVARSLMDNKRVVMRSFKGYSPYVAITSKFPASTVQCSFGNTNMDNDPLWFHFKVKNASSQCDASPHTKVAILRKHQETFEMVLSCGTTERLPTYIDAVFEVFD